MVSPASFRSVETQVRLIVILLAFGSLAFSACYYLFGWMADYGYAVCVYVEGVTLDSLTQEPLEGVRVEAYLYKDVVYLDTTSSAGVYRTGKIKQLCFASRKEIRDLESKPPLRRYLDLRMVLKKDGYLKSEMILSVEFVYCSPHPNPVEIPVVTIPDVLLVPE